MMDGQGPSIRGMFERHGLRCTRQREQIYSALACTKSHPTAEELFQAVQREEPGLSLATVYNTLEAFTARGLVHRIPCPSGAGPCRYDADTSAHVHLATEDGRVIDLPDDLSGKLMGGIPEAVLREVEQRLGVRLAGVNVQLVVRGRDETQHEAD